METLRDDWPYEGRQAVRPLSIIIVGAGIGGLSAGVALAQTGHNVTILESVSEIQEVGAGIQLAPNASRILHRLGLLEEIMKYATVLSHMSMRRYDSDDEISISPLMPDAGVKYGAPLSVIHRGHLQRILLDAARASGCRILTSHTVVDVDQRFSARVFVRDRGNSRAGGCSSFWMSGDLVIAADGSRSAVRRQMAAANGSKDQALRTGDAAYRLVVPRQKIQHDPVLTDMMARNVAVRYMGPGGHVMAYPLNSNQVYNLVLIHPAKDEAHQAESCSWTSRGHTRDMLDFYSSWSPAIQRWLQHAVADDKEDVLEWHLNTHPKLPTWFIGSVTLLGDACHPMLPYVAQGASNAIEDAAVLTMALTCTSDVQLALRAYQLVRKDRAERIAASASATAANLHLPDGPAQRVRDEAIMVASRIGKGMDTETETETKAENPDKLGNAAWQDFMWGVDVMKKTIENWAAIQEQCVLMPVPVPMPMPVPKPKSKKLANSTAVSRAFSNVSAYFNHVVARYSSPKLRSAYLEFLRGIANYYDLTIDQTTAILTLLRAFNPLRALGNVSLISRYAPSRTFNQL